MEMVAKMYIKNSFRIICISHLFLVAFASTKTLDTIKVLAINFALFTYYDPSDGFADGIDIHILRTITKRLNLIATVTKGDRIEQIPIEKLELVSHVKIHTRMAYYRFFLLFQYREYDLIIGGIHSNMLNSTKFVTSSPYMQDDLTWCVKRAKAIPRWKNIYYIPQDVETYVIGFIVYTLSIVSIYLLTAFEDKPLDFTLCNVYSIGCLAGFGYAYTPKKAATRFIVSIFFMSTFWMTQIYLSYLITYLRITLYENQIGTLGEITRKNFHLAGANRPMSGHISMVREILLFQFFFEFYFFKFHFFNSNSNIFHSFRKNN